MPDNRIFNVNGRTKEQLQLALQLLLLNEYGKKETVKGWYYSKKKGLVLTWFVESKYKAVAFTDRMGKPNEVDENELTDVIWNWLQSKEAKEVELEGWDKNQDHDGDNESGWRIYMEDWGHISDGLSTDHYSICAIKPVYLWYGK